MKNKQLVLTNEEYVHTKNLVENMLFFYRKDLSKYSTLLANKEYTSIEIINETKSITLTQDIIEEEIEFLTGEIHSTHLLLDSLYR